MIVYTEIHIRSFDFQNVGSKFGEEGCIRGFGGGNLREGDHSGDLGIDGRLILK
jgi:hypothetical protein